mgnify:CR=1 FL=1
MNAERRSEVRIESEIVVKIPAFGGKAKHPLNISPDGIMLESSRLLSVNSVLRMELHVPQTGLTIRAAGKVIWVYPRHRNAVSYRIGAVFQDLSAEEKERLRKSLRMD